MPPNTLVWVDVETTGLQPDVHCLLEVGAIATTASLTEFDRFSVLIRPYTYELERIDPYVLAMHTRSGLLAECMAKGLQRGEALHMFGQWLRSLGGRSEVYLAGSSVHFDRCFLERYMPNLGALVMHRMVDTSSTQLMNNAASDVDWTQGFAKNGAHRALADLHVSLHKAREQWARAAVPTWKPRDHRPLVLVATQNERKLRQLELQIMLEGDYDVRSLADAGQHADVDEPETTLAGNARIKAAAAWRDLHPCIHDDVAFVVADDSGLFVHALDGLPGVRSARFAADHGRPHTREASVELLLEKMSTATDRRAQYRSAFIVQMPSGEVLEGTGWLDGTIAQAPRMGNGLDGMGYDTVFLPHGVDGHTMSELTRRQYAEVSQRSLLGLVLQSARERMGASP